MIQATRVWGLSSLWLFQEYRAQPTSLPTNLKLTNSLRDSSDHGLGLVNPRNNPNSLPSQLPHSRAGSCSCACSRCGRWAAGQTGRSGRPWPCRQATAEQGEVSTTSCSMSKPTRGAASVRLSTVPSVLSAVVCCAPPRWAPGRASARRIRQLISARSLVQPTGSQTGPCQCMLTFQPLASARQPMAAAAQEGAPTVILSNV